MEKMKKCELIEKWQKEIEDDKERLDDKNLDYASRCQVLGKINAIYSILEDIKNLNGETVKQREYCPFCGSNNLDLEYSPTKSCNDCHALWAI